MPIFDIEFREQVSNYWTREIEADTLDEAQAFFLNEIQGTEPDDTNVFDSEFL